MSHAHERNVSAIKKMVFNLLNVTRIHLHTEHFFSPRTENGFFFIYANNCSLCKVRYYIDTDMTVYNLIYLIPKYFFSDLLTLVYYLVILFIVLYIFI